MAKKFVKPENDLLKEIEARLQELANGIVFAEELIHLLDGKIKPMIEASDQLRMQHKLLLSLDPKTPKGVITSANKVAAYWLQKTEDALVNYPSVIEMIQILLQKAEQEKEKPVKGKRKTRKSAASKKSPTVKKTRQGKEVQPKGRSRAKAKKPHKLGGKGFHPLVASIFKSIAKNKMPSSRDEMLNQTWGSDELEKLTVSIGSGKGEATTIKLVEDLKSSEPILLKLLASGYANLRSYDRKEKGFKAGVTLVRVYDALVEKYGGIKPLENALRSMGVPIADMESGQ